MAQLSSSGFVSGQSGTVNLPAGSDRILVARIFYHETTDQNTSPTYGGNAATGEIGDFVSDNTEGGLEMHYWLEADLPADGDNTFDIGSAPDLPGFGVVILSGRNQAAPDDFLDLTGWGGGDGATIGGTLTAAADDSDAVGCAETNAGAETYTPGTGQTEEFDADISGGTWQGTGSYETGLASGSQNHEYTLSSAKNQSFKAAIWQPAATGSPGLEGSVWIEGTDLHWIDANDTEQNVTGTDTGNDPAGAVAGSCWIDGSDLHYIDASGNERTITGTDAGNDPAGAVSGSAWIEGANLHYIDATGNERTIS